MERWHKEPLSARNQIGLEKRSERVTQGEDFIYKYLSIFSGNPILQLFKADINAESGTPKPFPVNFKNPVIGDQNDFTV